MTNQNHVSEQESRAVAEAARESRWAGRSVLRELFLGNFKLDLVHPFPPEPVWSPEFSAWMKRFRAFFDTQVDPVEIDRSGEYPQHVIDGLRELGAFGMKIPKEYGGLGFNQAEYCAALELGARYDANLLALLSAHQSIGVPQPIKLFGTPEQKQRFLPRCAKGAISAFALTEADVGSDPARLSTSYRLSDDGESYIIDGEKLWCTNGTIAELYVVMARNPDTKKISAFVVEGNSPGVSVVHRCRFMGLRALANGVIRFQQVKVPKDNLIGKEGAGLKIALTTLNTGRLSIPAGASGLGKQCLEICRTWATERVQWGVPIGKHEAIAFKLSEMAATTFAMESISRMCNALAEAEGYDIRLEAAAAKEWNTVMGWKIVDDTMQIRGGRGYETELSLKARGERPDPVERMMRDARINTIFEGSSEIMHLFMAREAVDQHLAVAGALVDPRASLGAKLAALPKIVLFYAWWYPTRWLGFSLWPRFAGFGVLGKHFRFIDRKSRKLARAIFHGMLYHGPKLERRQGFLFRLVDIGIELFAMATSAARAHAMVKSKHPSAQQAVELADVACRLSAARIERSFRDLFNSRDEAQRRLSHSVTQGQHDWLIEGGMPAAVSQSEAAAAEPRVKPARVAASA